MCFRSNNLFIKRYLYAVYNKNMCQNENLSLSLIKFQLPTKIVFVCFLLKQERGRQISGIDTIKYSQWSKIAKSLVPVLLVYLLFDIFAQGKSR